MATKKSSVVSGMGLAMSIIINLVKAVQKAGGTDDDIHRLATPEGEGLLEKIAEMVIQTKSAIQATFKVVVDYGQTLEKMVAAGKYDWVNSDITQEHFPVQGEGKKETEIVLFHFGKTMSSDAVLAEMKEADYQPAKIEELLALGATYPELQKQFPVVALGSLWRDPRGFRDVPFLDWIDVGRSLFLSWFVRDWDGYYRFAGVRK